jgi:phosphoribosylformylglycinamidine (FGAM) synthase-like amidotransferase family enzyme
MMPHPERACSEALGNTDGQTILRTLFINQAVPAAKVAVANF